jgi:hypothetical protein
MFIAASKRAVTMGGFVELDRGRVKDESKVGNEVVNGLGYV